MNMYIKKKFLILMTVCSGLIISTLHAADTDKVDNPQAPAVNQGQEGMNNEVRKDVDKYVIELDEEEMLADEEVRKGRSEFVNNKFKEARDYYLTAKQRLEGISGDIPRLKKKINDIDEMVATIYYFWAQSIADKAEEMGKAREYDQAIKLCMDAKEMSPTINTRADDLIQRFTQMKDVVKFRDDTSLDLILPTHKQKLYDIDVLFAQGKKYSYDGQYDKARDKFEEILVLNPYHAKTIRFIKLVYGKIYDAGKRRYEDTRKERLTETEWEHVSPILPRTFTGEKEALVQPVDKRESISDIQKKLDTIIIDHIEFEEVSIPVVVKYLKTRSKELDPEKEGVNIFLRLGTGGAPKPATGAPGGEDEMAPPPADGEEAPAEADAEADAEAPAENDFNDTEIGQGEIGMPAEIPTITMLVDEIPLIEAIKYICRGANLKWRVERYAVVIASQDVPLDELDTKIFPVEQDTIPLESADEGGGEGGGTSSVQGFFAQRGVTFPEGAMVVFDSRISRIIATNTPDNLEKIDKILKELNVTDPQVLIEAKFVEISQNDMNSLGFEWLVSKPSTLTNLSQSSMTFNQNDPLMRYSDDVSSQFSNGRDIVMNVVHQTGNGVTYQAMIHALNVCDSTDVLSTPRITTLNGEEATIRMITEVYLPESYSDANYVPGPPDIFTPSVPEFGEPTELGVRLTVTPTVDPDRFTIALDMAPVVQAFIGWTDYSYQLPATTPGVYYDNILRMPIIEARTITTQMTIYDGETVVMGGVSRDNKGYINDQIPALGEVPLIGRLFQSQVEDSQKRNLLIFTTVRLVLPDGAPYRAREIPGLPPFRQ